MLRIRRPEMWSGSSGKKAKGREKKTTRIAAKKESTGERVAKIAPSTSLISVDPTKSTTGTNKKEKGEAATTEKGCVNAGGGGTRNPTQPGCARGEEWNRSNGLQEKRRRPFLCSKILDADER